MVASPPVLGCNSHERGPAMMWTVQDGSGGVIPAMGGDGVASMNRQWLLYHPLQGIIPMR